MLDVEIARLSSRLLELKRKKNSSTKISSLPSELLCSVFVFCRDTWPEKPRAKMAWVVITHVCHDWRVLALGYSSLWGHLDSSVGYKWLSTLLQ
jgi:F-box-like